MENGIKQYVTPFIIGIGVVWIATFNPIVSRLPDLPLIGNVGLAGGLAMVGLTFALNKGWRFIPL